MDVKLIKNTPIFKERFINLKLVSDNDKFVGLLDTKYKILFYENKIKFLLLNKNVEYSKEVEYYNILSWGWKDNFVYLYIGLYNKVFELIFKTKKKKKVTKFIKYIRYVINYNITYNGHLLTIKI